MKLFDKILNKDTGHKVEGDHKQVVNLRAKALIAELVSAVE